MGREGRVKNTCEWAVPNWPYLIPYQLRGIAFRFSGYSIQDSALARSGDRAQNLLVIRRQSSRAAGLSSADFHRAQERKNPPEGGFFGGFKDCVSCLWNLVWCRHQESNSGPTDYKSVALPTELYRRYGRRVYPDVWACKPLITDYFHVSDRRSVKEGGKRSVVTRFFAELVSADTSSHRRAHRKTKKVIEQTPVQTACRWYH